MRRRGAAISFGLDQIEKEKEREGERARERERCHNRIRLNTAAATAIGEKTQVKGLFQEDKGGRRSGEEHHKKSPSPVTLFFFSLLKDCEWLGWEGRRTPPLPLGFKTVCD